MTPPVTELCHPSWKKPNGGPAVNVFSELKCLIFLAVYWILSENSISEHRENNK